MAKVDERFPFTNVELFYSYISTQYFGVSLLGLTEVQRAAFYKDLLEWAEAYIVKECWDANCDAMNGWREKLQPQTHKV